MKTLKHLSCLALLFVAMLAGNSAFAQQGQGGAKLTAAERAQMQVDRYQKQLDLTADQAAKVKTVVLAGVEEMEKSRASGVRPDRATMQAMAQKRNQDIRAILTAEQKAKFDQMLAAQAERGGQGQQADKKEEGKKKEGSKKKKKGGAESES